MISQRESVPDMQQTDFHSVARISLLKSKFGLVQRKRDFLIR